jgi:hypothetical protein
MEVTSASMLAITFVTRTRQYTTKTRNTTEYTKSDQASSWPALFGPYSLTIQAIQASNEATMTTTTVTSIETMVTTTVTVTAPETAWIKPS